MKYIINKSQLDKIIFEYLESYFKDMKLVHPTKSNKNYTQFWLSNEMVMDGIIGQELLVSEKVWNLFSDLFNLKSFELAEYLGTFLRKKYGFEWDDNIFMDDSIKNY